MTAVRVTCCSKWRH